MATLKSTSWRVAVLVGLCLGFLQCGCASGGPKTAVRRAAVTGAAGTAAAAVVKSNAKDEAKSQGKNAVGADGDRLDRTDETDSRLRDR